MHKLFCITNNKQYDITPLVGTISWKSSVDQLGVQLNFEDAYNDDRYFPMNPVDLGSMVVLSNQFEVYRGMVVKEAKNGRSPIQYNSFDFAFYLNKSKAIYQFNGMAADVAIKKILTDFNVPVGSITGIPVPITKIYPGDVVSDIIKDILKQAELVTGIKYRLEMRVDKLYIENQKDLIIAPTFMLADIFGPLPVTSAISNPSRSRSIEEMKNNIKLTNNNKVVSEVKSDYLIRKYGLLQEVQSIEDKDLGKAYTIAASQLKDLGRIMEENSIVVPGDDNARAGRLLEVTEPITGMKGLYLIKDVVHTIKSGIHTMQLGLGVA